MRSQHAHGSVLAGAGARVNVAKTAIPLAARTLFRITYKGNNRSHHCIAKQKTGGWRAEQSVFPASIYSTLRIAS